MVKSIVNIPGHRRLSDTTLKQMKKSEIIEYIRLLEYNWSIALDWNAQQARNFEEHIRNLNQFSPPERREP